MPSVDAIVYAGISGLIITMLGVIGFLLKSGFDGLRKELKALWDELKLHRTETSELKAEVAVLKSELHEHKERFKECRQIRQSCKNSDAVT